MLRMIRGFAVCLSFSELHLLQLYYINHVRFAFIKYKLDSWSFAAAASVLKEY